MMRRYTGTIYTSTYTLISFTVCAWLFLLSHGLLLFSKNLLFAGAMRSLPL